MLWFAFVTGMLVPLAMMACYPVFQHHARGEPSSWSGYRTARAMQGTASWRFANALAGRLWLHWGAALGAAYLVVFAVLLATGQRDEDTWLGVATAMALAGLPVMVASMVVVERRLAALPDHPGGRGQGRHDPAGRDQGRGSSAGRSR